MNNLAICYKNGKGTEKNLEKAFYWYQKAAEKGYIDAMNSLAICYKNGEGTEKNLEKAFYWYQKAAEKGYIDAMNNLAICYENGEGTEKNLEKAFHLYQKAAENGDKEAQFNLGVCYEEGIGIEKDEVKGSYWYQKAAQQGFSNAQYRLGFFYKIVKGVKEVLKNPFKKVEKGKLKNVEPLDAGKFGEISKAIWTKTNNYVVLKELYVALYANGGNLQNYLKNNFKNLTWNDKKKLAFQIADGLNYLHYENILHRDLHSKNIVIHESNAKITDFGISKNQNNQTSAYIGNFGVVAYMGPERLKNSESPSPYTKSSDIYSFGVLMWEISSGHPPFKDNDNIVTLTVSIITGIREVTVPDTPEEYEKLYKKCWNQEPEQRPSINEILDEFERMGFGNNATSKLVEAEKGTGAGTILEEEEEFEEFIGEYHRLTNSDKALLITITVKKKKKQKEK
ncbi:kinase-like protein [Rhizophagus irregularis]|uniref:Kinase-like protein n=1 Tax=Rhizophagus irregularis TaxID=588596 RepID=A0A2N1MPG7_9GLOM|nr:kinase-like protein [Rhizophagus irregularis]